MIRVGIIGLGHWGPNLIRVIGDMPDCRVTVICDRVAERRARMAEKFPGALATPDAVDVLAGGLVDAVILATPTSTHYQLARVALAQGLHVFVEKPLATSAAECEELIELAEAKDRKLFVGHVFLYTAAVRKLKDLVDGGDLGELSYVSSTRLNLGPVRHDVNALWDLAPHDISIMLHLMGSSPLSVSCSGLAHLNEHVHDVCSLTLQFEKNRMGIIHVSWLDPHKKRVMTVVGSKKMVVYDDIEPLEKIKVYDRGVESPRDADSFGDFQFSYRYGDMYSPRLEEVEPLKAECRSFIDSIQSDTRPLTDGYNGLAVVQVLEAAELSLLNGNGRVECASPDRRAILRYESFADV